MLTEIELSDIHPSPFRRLDAYPLDEERIQRLRSSIKRTDFWQNVVVRPLDGHYQLVYGHHRIEAARRELGTDATVHVIVKDLDDATMLKMAAADNDEVYNPGMSFILEVVEATMAFMGKDLSLSGKITTRKMRLARGAKLGEHRDFATQLAAFLDWPRSRIVRAVSLLKQIHDGQVSREAVGMLPTEESAREFGQRVRVATESGVKIPHRDQVKIATKVVQSNSRAAEAVKAELSEHVHPKQPEERDKVLDLIKETASRAHALDVALTELLKHRDKLHSEQYRTTLRTVHLAAYCESVCKLIVAIFRAKQLHE